jgi:tetratricopeptide (TPR) repeat protein
MNFLRSLKESTSKMSLGSLNPDQAEALWGEACDLFRSDKKKNHLKAIEIALRLIQEGPKNAVTKSKLQCFIADIYSQKLGEHDKAIEYYKEALKSDTLNSLAGSNLGFVYLRYKKDFESSERILKQTLDIGVSSSFVRETTIDLLAEARKALGK